MHFQRCVWCSPFKYEMASAGKNAVGAGLRPRKSSDLICQGRNCFVGSTLAISLDFLLKKTIILFIVVSRMIVLITRATSDHLWPQKWGDLTWQRAHLNNFWSKKYDIATWRIIFLLSWIPLWKTIFPKNIKQISQINIHSLQRGEGFPLKISHTFSLS